MTVSRRCASPNCLNDAAPENTFCYKCILRKWRANNPVRTAYNTLRDNAKRRGKVFTLTFEYFEEFCRANNYVERRGNGSEDLTIDRIDPHRGYEPGNIQVLTRADNNRKKVSDAKKYKSICPREEGDPF